MNSVKDDTFRTASPRPAAATACTKTLAVLFGDAARAELRLV
jgi:hypothetical protein